MEFMSSTRAMEMLETGLVVGMNPVITMFFKEQTRDMFPSQAAWSHQLGVRCACGVGYVGVWVRPIHLLSTD